MSPFIQTPQDFSIIYILEIIDPVAHLLKVHIIMYTMRDPLIIDYMFELLVASILGFIELVSLGFVPIFLVLTISHRWWNVECNHFSLSAVIPKEPMYDFLRKFHSR